MSSAKPVAPLTLATARIVHTTGIRNDKEQVIDGALVARLIEATDPEDLSLVALARQVGNAACVLRCLASDLAENESAALYFVAETLSSIACRLDVMSLDRSARFRIEPAAEAAR